MSKLTTLPAVRCLHPVDRRRPGHDRRVGVGNGRERYAAPAEGVQNFVMCSQIAALRSTGKSLMPDGFEENLSPEDVADLLAFLAQPDARLFCKAK